MCRGEMLMTISMPNYPRYFIDDKGLIGMVCIYIVRADTFKTIPIDASLDPWPYHLAYVPSLVSISSGQREEPTEFSPWIMSWRVKG